MIKKLFPSLILISLMLSIGQNLYSQIKFSVRMADVQDADQPIYSVYAKNSNQFPTSPPNTAFTINVALKIPGDYSLDTNLPNANTHITNLGHGIFSEQSSRNDPFYSNGYDYLYFAMAGAPSFAEWTTGANVEIELFRFSMKNSDCESGIFQVIDNNTDPIVSNETSQDFTNNFYMPSHPIVGGYNGNYSNELVNNCSGIVAVHSKLFNESISIFPNPANETATINYSFTKATDLNVRISNGLGQKVYEKVAHQVKEGEIKVDVSRFASGIYFVDITDGDYQFKDQLLIENN